MHLVHVRYAHSTPLSSRCVRWADKWKAPFAVGLARRAAARTGTRRRSTAAGSPLPAAVYFHAIYPETAWQN